MYTTALILGIICIVGQLFREFDSLEKERIIGRALFTLMAIVGYVYCLILLIGVARFVNGTIPQLSGSGF